MKHEIRAFNWLIGMFASAIFAMIIFVAINVSATPGGEPNNTNCQGQGNPNSPCAPGGDGPGGGGGGGGGSVVIGDIDVDLSNSNTNTLTNQQQQQQQIIDNSSVTATGGNATATANPSASSDATATVTGISSVSSANGSVEVTNNISSGGGGGPDINIGGNVHQDRLQAPSIFPSNLTAAYNSCGLSWTVGGAAPGFGLSIGKTYIGDSCEAMTAATGLFNMNLPHVGIARMCLEKKLGQSLEREYPGICTGEQSVSDYMVGGYQPPEYQLSPIKADAEARIIQAVYKPECRGASSRKQDQEFRLRGKCI